MSKNEEGDEKEKREEQKKKRHSLTVYFTIFLIKIKEKSILVVQKPPRGHKKSPHLSLSNPSNGVPHPSKETLSNEKSELPAIILAQPPYSTASQTAKLV